ncbi:hypothetical protein T439DRAFT_377000 [Meredithblackwellia eburnea MCA 4105]
MIRRRTFQTTILLTLPFGLVFLFVFNMLPTFVRPSTIASPAKVQRAWKDLMWKPRLGWSRDSDELLKISPFLLDEEVPFELQEPSPGERGLKRPVQQEVDPVEADKLKVKDELMLLEAPSNVSVASCPPSLLASLQEASFWTVTPASRRKYLIHPTKAPSPSSPIHCFARASFSARLVSDVYRRKPITHALPPPVPSLESLGKYVITLDYGLLIPLDTYRLEIFLESGSLLGGRAGDLCGKGSIVCHQEDLSNATLPYVGKIIKGAAPIQVRLGQRPASLTPLKLCNGFSRLSGYWQGQDFYPINWLSNPRRMEPCSLLTPFLPFSQPTPRLKPKRRGNKQSLPEWINFVGDTSLRSLSTVLLDLLKSKGGGSDVVWSELAADRVGGPVSSIGFRSSINKARDGEIPDVIVTWSFWSPTDELVGAKTRNRTDLVPLTTSNLREFIKHTKLEKVFNLGFGKGYWEKGGGKIQPTVTYVSLGREAQSLTIAGIECLFDHLFSAETKRGYSALKEANMKFLTVNAPIPNHPQSQSLFEREQDSPSRNISLTSTSVDVEAKNEFIRSYPGIDGRIFDYHGIVSGIDVSMEGASVGDWTVGDGTRRFVLTELAKAVWTDTIVNGA